jgi:hypothetical protein
VTTICLTAHESISRNLDSRGVRGRFDIAGIVQALSRDLVARPEPKRR